LVGSEGKYGRSQKVARRIGGTLAFEITVRGFRFGLPEQFIAPVCFLTILGPTLRVFLRYEDKKNLFPCLRVLGAETRTSYHFYSLPRFLKSRTVVFRTTNSSDITDKILKRR